MNGKKEKFVSPKMDITMFDGGEIMSTSAIGGGERKKPIEMEEIKIR